MVIPDAPARALVIFGDGLAGFVKPSHMHLHALAASGACGFLALRQLPPHIECIEHHVYEMRQLLDAHVLNMVGEGEVTKENNVPSISERFMGMKAAMATVSKLIACLGKKLGFQLIEMDDSNGKVKVAHETSVFCSSTSKLPTPSILASQLLEVLALGGSCSEEETFELVMLHVGRSSENGGLHADPTDVDWIDALLGAVKDVMLPGSKAADHLYIALLLGFGDTTGPGNTASLEQLDGLSADLKALRPVQTYRMKDGKLVNDVRDHHPLLVVHQMDGVTRRDEAQMLAFEEFQKKGGNLAILADRFLHEVAFKLWKAPKYGA